VNDGTWPMAGFAAIEKFATLLTFGLAT